jgi:hypothetical protein
MASSTRYLEFGLSCKKMRYRRRVTSLLLRPSSSKSQREYIENEEEGENEDEDENEHSRSSSRAPELWSEQRKLCTIGLSADRI